MSDSINAVNHKGLRVGFYFTLLSFLVMPTVLIPALSVAPAVITQFALVSFTTLTEGGATAFMLILLSILILLLLSLSLLKINRKIYNKENVTVEQVNGIMIYSYFIIHPLGLYFFLTTNSVQQVNTDILAEAFFTSWPITSCSFIVIGHLIDIVKNNAVRDVEDYF